MPVRTRCASFLGLVWLALFPLLQDGSYAHITRAKWVAMLALTGVTALLGVVMLADAAVHRDLRPRMAQALAAVYFLLVAGSAVHGGAAASINETGLPTVLYGAKRYEGLYTQLCYGGIFLCMSLARPRLKTVLDGAAGVLLAFCAMVALQYAGVNVLGLFPQGHSIRTNYEFQGTIGNIDMVSGYLSLVMPALLVGDAASPRPLWLAAGMAGVGLMLCMEVQSGLIVLGVMAGTLALLALRTPVMRPRVALILGLCAGMATLRLLLGLPWLDGTAEVSFPHAFTPVKLLPAAVGGLLVGLAWRLKRHPGRPWQGWQTLLLALVIAAVGVTAVYIAPLPAGNGLWELQELLHGRPQDSFGSERIGVWRLTLELSRLYPLWGTGPDTFLYSMEDYMFQTGQRLVQRFDNPHNMLLAILVNNGIPALAAFVLLCGWVLVRGARQRDAWPLWLGCLCYLVQGMFTFSICLVTPMFWGMLGMCAAVGRTSPAAAAATSPERGGKG